MAAGVIAELGGGGGKNPGVGKPRLFGINDRLMSLSLGATECTACAIALPAPHKRAKPKTTEMKPE